MYQTRWPGLATHKEFNRISSFPQSRSGLWEGKPEIDYNLNAGLPIWTINIWTCRNNLQNSYNQM